MAKNDKTPDELVGRASGRGEHGEPGHRCSGFCPLYNHCTGDDYGMPRCTPEQVASGEGCSSCVRRAS